MRAALPALLLLTACSRHTCEGYIPILGSGVTFALHELGYFDGDSGFADLYESGNDRVIITDPDEWRALADSFSYTGPEPDFAVQAAFINHWADGGCTDPFTYSGLRRDTVLQMMGREGHDGGCDAYFPTSDLLIVDLDGATELRWCDSD